MNTKEMIGELMKNDEKIFVHTDNKNLRVTVDTTGYIRFDTKKHVTYAPHIGDSWKEIPNGIKVSFREVIKTHKKVKVVHPISDKLFTGDSYEKYEDVLYSLALQLLTCELLEVIIDGDWYIEN